MKRVLFLLLLAVLGCSKADRLETAQLLRDGGEYWETLSIDDKAVGFQRTSLRHVAIDGERRLQFELQSRLTILRHGRPFDVAMSLSSLSTPSGEFVSATTDLNSGLSPVYTEYKVEGDKLLVVGEKDRTLLPWSTPLGGPETILRRLLEDPITANRRCTLKFFDPTLQQSIEATLSGGGVEMVDLRGTPRKLQRIDILMKIGSGESARTQTSTLWTDDGGNVFRSRVSMGDTNILAVRVDKETALAGTQGGPNIELGPIGMVPLPRPITGAREAPSLTFMVRLKTGSPENRFPPSPFQSVMPLSDSFAKVRVWSAVGDDPTRIGNSAYRASKSEALPEDLASGTLIDLADPKLKEFAATVDGSLAPWPTAQALERLVHASMQETTFSLAFASSSEVLKAMRGDCTEYAVLLAALCRSKMIPCRLVFGLVYSPLAASDPTASGAMAFHLWNEVLIDGVWRPLDATFGQGGANAARLKIADVNLAADSLAALTNSILGVIDQLEIEAVEYTVNGLKVSFLQGVLSAKKCALRSIETPECRALIPLSVFLPTLCPYGTDNEMIQSQN